ncbi:hypothetical protein D5018_09445 [Parashewanella curva]|uniref:Uncharacterized protein n=1 Tax=Parashewanella curva TaxID=2338552 RepID=A0A3L8PZE5_9GAMM|nr:hypothetical protein [Parashewanella curva]RLV59898.1 hypothetical protein D5018_09445 [Parashewanella curva]
MSTPTVPLSPPPQHKHLSAQQSFNEEDRCCLIDGEQQQIIDFLKMNPETRLDFVVKGEPLLIHLAKCSEYNKLNLFVAHLKQKGEHKALQCVSSQRQTLLHILFSKDIDYFEVDFDLRLDVIRELIPLIELTKLDGNGDTVIELALKKPWDDFSPIRQDVLLKLKEQTDRQHIEIKGEPLLVFIARETESYSEPTLGQLLDNKIGHVVEVADLSEVEPLEDDLFVGAGSPQQTTMFDVEILAKMKIRRGSKPRVRSQSEINLPKTIAEERWEVTEKAGIEALKHNVAELDEQLQGEMEEYFPATFEVPHKPFSERVEGWVAHTMQVAARTIDEGPQLLKERLEQKLLGRFERQDLAPLLINEEVPVSDARRRSSVFSSESSAAAISPIRELEGQELDNVKKKLLLFRNYQEKKQQIKKRAEVVAETNQSYRDAIQTRKHSLLPDPHLKLTVSGDSVPVVVASTEEVLPPRPSDTYSSVGELNHALRLWHKAIEQVKTVSAREKIGWDPTLFLAEKKLREIHQQEKEETQKQWQHVKNEVHAHVEKFREKNKQLADTSSLGGYQSALDKMNSDLESFHMEGDLEQASGVLQQVGQLVQLLMEGRDVIKGWKFESIDAATNSLSAAAGAILGAGELGAGFAAFVSHGTIKEVAEGIASGCGIVNEIQTCINEVIHMVVDICHLVEEFTEGDPVFGPLENKGAVGILKKGAGFAKQLLRIIRTLLKATKGILNLLEESTLGVAQAIPGLGILLNIITITERAIFLADSAFSYSELSESKHRLKQILSVDRKLNVMFYTSGKTNIKELEYITQDAEKITHSADRLYQVSLSDILEAKRYELVRELKSICGKRILRNAYEIAFNLGEILGEGLKIGGVTAEAGIVVGASISITRAGITGLNQLKKLYHSRHEDEKSPKAKHQRRCRIMETFFLLTYYFACQDFSDSTQSAKYAAQYQELRQYFYAMGLRATDIIGREMNDELLKFVYEKLKQREP